MFSPRGRRGPDPASRDSKCDLIVCEALPRGTLAGAKPQPEKTCGSLEDQITICQGDDKPQHFHAAGRQERPVAPDLRRRRFVEVIGALLAHALVVDAPVARADDGTADFRMIVHPENPNRSVSRRFLSEAFLKDVSRWDDDVAIHPVDLRADSPIRRVFS